MEIFIRRMSVTDAAAVNALTHQLGYPLSPEQTMQNISAVIGKKDHETFVAVYDNAVIGWIGLAISFQIEMPSYCEIRGLVVDDNYRNHGIGKMLIEKAKLWAKETGNDKLRLRCNVIRTETHLFYQHIGFKETKQQKVFEMEL
ncbi:MAG: GNAT family N-acetyltransferase [Bacteroidota bacterium]